jgi:hypothetical protein
MKRNKKLASAIRIAGFGYSFVDGSWNETGKDGNKIFVKEDSVIVTSEDNNKLKRLGIKWMDNKWNSGDTDANIQDSIIFKPDGGDDVFLIFNKKTNHEEQKVGKFKEKTIEDIKTGMLNNPKYGGEHTKLRKRGERTFVFERAYEDVNWMTRAYNKDKSKYKTF